MLENIPTSAAPALNRTSVALIRASLLKFAGLLVSVFLLAACLLFYVAHDLDTVEEHEGIFYINKAIKSVEKHVTTTVKDYASWGEAYKHLHQMVDVDWAFAQANIGSGVYKNFGYQGVFVVDGADRTVYSVIRGELKSVDIAQWLGRPIDALLNEARAAAGKEAAVSTIVNFGGIPAVVAASALTPGNDLTVEAVDGPVSVLVFVEPLDSARLQAIGTDYGIKALRIVTHDKVSSTTVQLGEDGSAGHLLWELEKPGKKLLGFMLPLIGVAASVVWLMTWVLLRRTTFAAKTLEDNYASLQTSQIALIKSEQRFRDVAEASSDWIWEIDAQGQLSYLSERFEEITGLSRNAWIGADLDNLLRFDSGKLSQWLKMPKRHPNTSVQCSYIDSQGQARIARLHAREMVDEGFRGTACDITDEVEARRRIDYLSQHDALTGLPNRTRLQAFLDGKLRAVSTREAPLVMLCLDLDRFKPVNDLLGHAAGDHVLNTVSKRLGDCVRTGDLVARIGGDEFVLIITDMSSQDEIDALCQRLIHSIEEPIALGAQEVFVSASIGIAMAPNDACEAAQLMRYADIALYEAKAGGRHTWRFYAGDMNAKIIERRRLESDLRYAIKHGELRLHFQPRVRIVDGRLVGAEALVRWQHPVHGLVSPDTFIPIAEESGLIVSLSDWVLTAACESANHWPNNMFVSINLSSTEFRRGNLVARVQKALCETGFDPTRLELELTENIMLVDATGALEIMRALKGLGVRLAMDDFGTGYSSLSYLRSFPFDGLKIDRSFVNRLGENEKDKSVIQAIVGLGRALSLTVTAEGIETAEQLELLKAVLCDEGQGYFLSRPLDSEAFDLWVRDKKIEQTGPPIPSH
ncbi:EAL domain-containing protein [Pseudomonas sp. D4-18]|uniref:bifunctional diguanylate cyclase/phosphodiesterase n=1 Tax=Pseudomonas sp. D4-18 TaxID=2817395 RepID=UPI003DA8E9C7